MAELIMFKNKYYVLLFILQLLSLIFIVVFEDSFIYETININKHTSIDYDSRSINPEKARIKTIFEHNSSNIKEVDISFRMKVYSIEDYGNVFQTAPSNDGIRLELGSPSAMALIVKHKGTNEPFGILLTNSLVLNEWYQITINVDKNSRIKVLVNNLTVVDSKYKGIGEIGYDISDIAIGSGFSKTRDFDGELANFTLKYKLFKKKHYLPTVLLLCKIILILFIIVYIRPFVPRVFLSAITLSRENKINLISSFILIGFILSGGHYYFLSYGGFHNNIYDFMLSTIDIFKDFTNLNFYVQDNNPYSFNTSPVCPFPFLFRIAYLFAILPANLSIMLYMILFIVFLLFYCYRNISIGNKTSNINNVLILSFLTYPFLFTLSRGNYEAIVFIFIALFVYFYDNKKGFTSIVFLSFAIAMKLYPAIFLILFLSDKKYKEMSYTVLLVVLVTVVSYASFEGGFLINLKLNLSTLKKYSNEYVIGNAGLGYGNSLFGAIKTLMAYLCPKSYGMIIKNIFKTYAWLTLILGSLISVYIIIVEKEYWKKIALLVFCMNLFPYVSADYKLIHLLIPLFLYINKTNSDDKDLIYLIMFVLLLIPKSYYYFHFEPPTAISPFVVNTAGILNPALMVMGVLIIIASGINIKYNYSPMIKNLFVKKK